MKPKGSLPHSQELATCLCFELDQSSPCPLSHSFQSHFSIFPYTPGSSRGLFPSGFPTKTLCTFPHNARSPAHFISLHLITRIIFGKECQA
jgi:hypothetical protein